MNTSLFGVFILLGGLSLGCGHGSAAPMEKGESKPFAEGAQHGWKLKITDRGSAVLHSADGGKHWADVSPDALKREVKILVAGKREDFLADSSSLCPIDDRSAWLAVTAGKEISMEYTDDSGRHWKETKGSIAADAVNISFLDESRGFLLASSSPAAGQMSKLVYGTEDGGQKWRRLSSPKAVSYYTTGISFRSSSDGWITGTYHGGDDAPLYRTRDGGKSWRLQKLDIPADFRGGYADTYPPVFIGKDRKRGWLPVKLVRHEPAPDHESWVNYLSEDGGKTWHLPKKGGQAARK